MTPAPTVSVVLPVYNAARFLRLTLESLAAQTFRDFEIIAIDDGSTDGSLAILKAFADSRMIIREHERNQGLVATLNEGIACARGRYVARLDADDLVDPERFAEQVRVMDARPELLLLGTARTDIDENGQALKTHFAPPTDARVIAWKLLTGNFIPHPSVMLRREGLPQPLYDERFRHSEDYEAWLKLSRRGSLGMLKRPLLNYRVHAASVTRTHLWAQVRASLVALNEHLNICWGREFSLDSLCAWTAPQEISLRNLPPDFAGLVRWMDPRGRHFDSLFAKRWQRWASRWHYFRRLVLLTWLSRGAAPFPRMTVGAFLRDN